MDGIVNASVYILDNCIPLERTRKGVLRTKAERYTIIRYRAPEQAILEVTRGMDVSGVSSRWGRRLAMTETSRIDDFIELLYTLLRQFDLALILPTTIGTSALTQRKYRKRNRKGAKRT